MASLKLTAFFCAGLLTFSAAGNVNAAPGEDEPPVEGAETDPAEESLPEVDSSGAADAGYTLQEGDFDTDSNGRSVSASVLLGAAAEDLETAQEERGRRADNQVTAEQYLVDAKAELSDAVARKAAAEATAASYSTRELAAISQISEAQASLRDRAVSAYVAGPSAPFDAFVGADINQSASRGPYLQVAAGIDLAAIALLESARSEAGARAVETAETILTAADDIARQTAEVVAADEKVAAAIEAVDSASRTIDTLALRVSVLEGRSERLVYPIAGATWFVDTWGAPRSGGRQHEGVDIIADEGSPLLAIESGTIVKMGYVSLGGWRIWLQGDSGNAYYYAHLFDYADGISVGDRVELGQQIGWVGRTGNARFSVPHLHLEVHPGGRGAPPVNPFPLMYSLAGDSKTTGGGIIGSEPAQITF